MQNKNVKHTHTHTHTNKEKEKEESYLNVEFSRAREQKNES
jgi:hypothetical protein